MSARVPFLAGTGNTHCAGCLHPGFSVNLHGKGFGGAVGSRQIGGDFFTNQIPKLFLRLAVRPFGSEEDLVQPLSTIPMTLELLAPLLPAEPLPELSLLEGDLRALGQPMSSILELGIDLAHLNCTLQPYYFQPLVT